MLGVAVILCLTYASVVIAARRPVPHGPNPTTHTFDPMPVDLVTCSPDQWYSKRIRLCLDRSNKIPPKSPKPPNGWKCPRGWYWDEAQYCCPTWQNHDDRRCPRGYHQDDIPDFKIRCIPGRRGKPKPGLGPGSESESESGSDTAPSSEFELPRNPEDGTLPLLDKVGQS